MPLALRSFHGLSATNDEMLLLFCVPLSKSKPENVSSCDTAGWESKIFSSWSPTAVLLDSEADGSSCATTISIPWSSSGSKLPGTTLKSPSAPAKISAIITADTGTRRMKKDTQPVYLPVNFSKNWSNW